MKPQPATPAFALALVLCASTVPAQSAPMVNANTAPQSSAADLDATLRGEWVGVLEYRDYSEPPTSTKRVALPTWLSIASEPVSGAASNSASTAAPVTQQWHYIYDDGPGKTVDERDTVAFDPARDRYTATPSAKPAQAFTVAGYSTLKGGRGTLLLTGTGIDAGKPAEIRETLTIRRNLLEILEEARPAASQDAFAFRHLYRFVRRDAPAVTAPR